jgi:hypothetical protein
VNKVLLALKVLVVLREKSDHKVLKDPAVLVVLQDQQAQ